MKIPNKEKQINRFFKELDIRIDVDSTIWEQEEDFDVLLYRLTGDVGMDKFAAIMDDGFGNLTVVYINRNTVERVYYNPVEMNWEVHFFITDKKNEWKYLLLNLYFWT